MRKIYIINIEGIFELILALSIGDNMVQYANCKRKINASIECFCLDKLSHVKINLFENKMYSQSIPAIRIFMQYFAFIFILVHTYKYSSYNYLKI